MIQSYNFVGDIKEDMSGLKIITVYFDDVSGIVKDESMQRIGTGYLDQDGLLEITFDEHL